MGSVVLRFQTRSLRDGDAWALPYAQAMGIHARSDADSVVVLVAGIPGAGKTTLIDRAVSSPPWTVLDTDRFRRRQRPALRRLPVPYVLYVFAIIAGIVRNSQVVVQSRGTYAWLRRLVTACARAYGREAVLLMLDAPRADAVAGQVDRGRVVPSRVMRWHNTQ